MYVHRYSTTIRSHTHSTINLYECAINELTMPPSDSLLITLFTLPEGSMSLLLLLILLSILKWVGVCVVHSFLDLCCIIDYVECFVLTVQLLPLTLGLLSIQIYRVRCFLMDVLFFKLTTVICAFWLWRLLFSRAQHCPS